LLQHLIGDRSLLVGSWLALLTRRTGLALYLLFIGDHRRFVDWSAQLAFTLFARLAFLAGCSLATWLRLCSFSLLTRLALFARRAWLTLLAWLTLFAGLTFLSRLALLTRLALFVAACTRIAAAVLLTSAATLVVALGARR